MTFLSKSIEDIFTSCSLCIIPTKEAHGGSSGSGDEECDLRGISAPASSAIVVQSSEEDKHHHRGVAYYHDGSQTRAKVVVPMLLKFENSLDRDRMVSSNIIQPRPVVVSNKSDESPISRDRHLWQSSIDTIGFLQEDEIGESDKHLQFKFECISKTLTGNDADDVVVEGVHILSTDLVDPHALPLPGHNSITKQHDDTQILDDMCGIRFDVEITVRALKKYDDNEDHPHGVDTSKLLKVSLEIRSILECSYKSQNKDTTKYPPFLSPRDHTTNNVDNSHFKPIDDLYLGMQSLDFATEATSPDQVRTIRLEETVQRKQQPVISYFSQTKTYVLPPYSSHTSQHKVIPPTLIVDLLPALFVSVKEISGDALTTGVTLVSLGIYHSNLHNEPIAITNIALHPGHSRLFHSDAFPKPTDGIKGGDHAVINMTRNVRWGYVSGTAPFLPLILTPHEAFATVIEVHAHEVMAQRTFISPVCVRAIVGDTDRSYSIPSPCSNEGTTLNPEASDSFRDANDNSKCHLTVTADAKWSTCAITIGPTDAFRMNLAVGDSTCQVGALITVSLKIANLSLETRDLMLIMAKDECKDENKDDDDKNNNNSTKVEDKLGDSSLEESTILNRSLSTSEIQFTNKSATSSKSERNPVNDAIVYEVDNHTFGAWGLGENDDGTVRHTRDHDLLAVDAALLLGEVRGQKSLEAELRFVALRDGKMNVPNFKLYDRIQQKWYDCNHNLKIVAMKKQ